MSNLIERLRDRYSKHSQELRDEAADEIERLQEVHKRDLAEYNRVAADVTRLRAVVDAASEAWFKSGAFDNYECYFGAKLGKCPQSNDCWECQLHQALKTAGSG